MKLAELQQRFCERVTRVPEARSAADCFVSTPQLSADERLEIYANMFVWRQIDALREDFPKLAQLLGDEGFYATAEKYLRVDPSTQPSLGQLGRHFASFVAETAGHRADLAIVPLWKELEDGAPPSAPRAEPTAVAVWRKGFVVFHAGIAPDEAVALRRAMSGAPLGEVCEAFAERPDAVQAALSAVASWFAEEWIAAPEER